MRKGVIPNEFISRYPLRWFEPSFPISLSSISSRIDFTHILPQCFSGPCQCVPAFLLSPVLLACCVIEHPRMTDLRGILDENIDDIDRAKANKRAERKAKYDACTDEQKDKDKAGRKANYAARTDEQKDKDKAKDDAARSAARDAAKREAVARLGVCPEDLLTFDTARALAITQEIINKEGLVALFEAAETYFGMTSCTFDPEALRFLVQRYYLPKPGSKWQGNRAVIKKGETEPPPGTRR